MFVTTFYSYKGGVGRTMALANVAASLLKRGKRVLVVDFDLEAPSLQNYICPEIISGTLGIVDYITDYVNTNISPDAKKYISERNFSGGNIWTMCAGDYTDANYSKKLSNINFQDLYEKRSGFLFFEDLKQQWSTFFGDSGFDYVLIDSRTGHTDVGGICTRQLPDAVVIMFLPNHQNIDGLLPIVDGIRVRPSLRKRPMSLIFCASNVPDIDDEEEILEGLLKRASHGLSIEREHLSTIHHYGSLSLLQHEIFTYTRPASRLSKEYSNLEERISSNNPQDAHGAKFFLRETSRSIRERIDVSGASWVSRFSDRDNLRDYIEGMVRIHSSDGELCMLAAYIFNELGYPGAELEALSLAIQSNYHVNEARLARVRVRLSLQLTADAVEDLQAVLHDENARGYEINSALYVYRAIGEDWRSTTVEIIEKHNKDVEILIATLPVALSDRNIGFLLSDKLLTIYEKRKKNYNGKDILKEALSLSLISSGQFGMALEILGSIPDVNKDLSSRFNQFIARWKKTGSPDLADAVEINDIMEGAGSDRGANFLQCKSLISAVLGDDDKSVLYMKMAKDAAGKGKWFFSCLTYLYLDYSDFVEEVSKAIDVMELGLPLSTLIEFENFPKH